MIYNTLVWTKRGWLKAEELVIGDIVISYNPLRNCTEYDKISSIKMDYAIKPILGLKSRSMTLKLTPDHPFIIKNNVHKTVERKTIDDVFLRAFNEGRTVLQNSPFEPYALTQNLDDIAWTARVASSFDNTLAIPIEYSRRVWNIIEELGGIEAQHWIDVFFHWNILLPATHWSKAVLLRNKDVRKMVYHIAPRAGFGAKFSRYPRNTRLWMMGLATQHAPQIRISNWFRDRIEGYFFDIKTKNGSFLARAAGGTFLCPCDIT